jgi:spermidine synthase
MALVPFIELHTIGFAIALLNLLVAAFLALRFRAAGMRRAPRVALSAALGALLVWGLLSGPAITQYMLRRYYFYPQTTGQPLGALFFAMPAMPPVLRENSPYQKIDLVHYPATERFDELLNAWSTKFLEKPLAHRDRFLFLNGDPQFASNFEEVYHEWFAHVPIIAGGKVPKRVLVLGGGDGILHRELIKYDDIESITHVDIDRRLVDLARTDPVLTEINEHALEDPRVHMLFLDAYQYLRNYRGPAYDAIYMDFPLVQDYNLSRLYTREFFEYARAHMADDGFMVMDAPMLLLIEDQDMEGHDRMWQAGSWHVHSNTIRQAGFETVVSFYTVLERDNPRAREMLSQREDLMPPDVAASEAARREWIDRYIDRFTRGLRQGFIMLRKDERHGPYSYVDFGIHTRVLTPARFDLAFPIPAEESREVDLGSVNSILRPTLPEGMVGKIRKAW